MAFIPKTIIFLVILGLTAGFIALGIRKDASGLKLMLLGINITLLAGIIVVDPQSYLGGVEYLIALLGLIISVIGLRKED